MRICFAQSLSSWALFCYHANDNKGTYLISCFRLFSVYGFMQGFMIWLFLQDVLKSKETFQQSGTEISLEIVKWIFNDISQCFSTFWGSRHTLGFKKFGGTPTCPRMTIWGTLRVKHWQKYDYIMRLILPCVIQLSGGQCSSKMSIYFYLTANIRNRLIRLYTLAFNFEALLS